MLYLLHQDNNNKIQQVDQWQIILNACSYTISDSEILTAFWIFVEGLSVFNVQTIKRESHIICVLSYWPSYTSAQMLLLIFQEDFHD